MTPALLVLEDGSVFRGQSLGAEGVSVGEVVFNTAMTGYQEILTDPSYARQIVTLTYPQIGNTGVNDEDVESDRIHAAGLVIRQAPRRASSWRMRRTLGDYLAEQGIVAITDVDTRRLTRLIRERGALAGCIAAGDVSVETALTEARGFPGLKGMDLAREVSRRDSIGWTQTSWSRTRGYGELGERRFHVVAYDFGVKRNILRLLAERGCALTVVPATTPAEDVLALAPGRRVSVQRSGRPGALRLRHPRHRLAARRRNADIRHLPRPSAAGPGQRGANPEDGPWPPWRQPSGERPARRPGPGNQPEPWFRRGQ